MSKQLVRLTESDLHKIVEESVKSILCELDPRTYAWAANQRQRQGYTNSASKLRNKATRTWNNQYGTPNGQFERQENGSWKQRQMTANNGDGSYRVNDNEYVDKGFNHKDNYTQQNGFTFHPETVQNSREYYNYHGLDAYDVNDIDTEYFNTDDKGLKVAQQMANGKGKYIKGKGWQ